MIGVGSPLGTPVQVAYAVRDVREAAARFAATTGAGPFFVIEHIALATARVHGRAATFDHSSAYGQWGPVMVELVEEHGVALRPVGTIHHVAFMVDSLPDASGWCNANGWPEVLLAETSGGQRFAFHDATDELGHLVELYEPSAALLSFYAMVAAASKV